MRAVKPPPLPRRPAPLGCRWVVLSLVTAILTFGATLALFVGPLVQASLNDQLNEEAFQRHMESVSRSPLGYLLLAIGMIATIAFVVFQVRMWIAIYRNHQTARRG